MIGRLLAAGALLAAAGSASAGFNPGMNDVGSYTVNRLDGSIRPNSPFIDRATANAYADWATPGTGVINGLLTTGLNRLDGDRVNIVPNGLNLLSSMGYSFANTNPTGSTARVTGVSSTVSFFDGVTLAGIGSFTTTSNLSTLVGGGLAAQASIRLTFAANSLEAFNIFLTPSTIVTITTTAVTFNAGTGTDPALNGQQIRNPVSIGSSADELILNGNIVADPFGAAPAPDGNVSLLLITNDIPTPSTLALLGLGGLIAGRRRR